MKVFAIIYYLLAAPINMYIYVFLIVGYGKFKLDAWFYDLIVTIIVIVMLKIQPRLMRLALDGYGSLMFFFASVVATTSYMLLAFLAPEQKSWGYFAVLFLAGSVMGIDLMAKFTLARYQSYKPVYYSNTWFWIWNSMSVAIGTVTLGALYKKDHKAGEYYTAMVVLGSLSAGAAFIA
jgi:hypothetical protein